MSRWSRSVAALAALATVLAGCGGDSKTFDFACQGKLRSTARYNTVVALYRRGELGTRAQLERWARKNTGYKVPFLDEHGRIIPYERMNNHQRIDTDNFTLDVTGLNDKVAGAVNRAMTRANRVAATRCA